MGLGEISDRNAVLAAVREFDDLGRSRFLDKYGFGPARQYVLIVGARMYDAKAIVGAAHGHQFPDLGPLKHSDFSGGQDGANRVLLSLGFRVADVTSWTAQNEREFREEL